MTGVEQTLSDIADEFALLPDWEERIAHVIELGRELDPLSESEHAQDECILLPLYHQLTREEQQFIASELRAVLTAQCVA